MIQCYRHYKNNSISWISQMWEAPPPPQMSRTTRLSEVLNIFLFLSIRNFLLQFILLILTSQKYQELQYSYSNNDMQHFAKINQKQTNFCNLEFPLKLNIIIWRKKIRIYLFISTNSCKVGEWERNAITFTEIY